jgi:outer membrane lipase/esterase
MRPNFLRQLYQMAKISSVGVLSSELATSDSFAQPLGQALSDQLLGECGRLLGTDLASEVLTGRLEVICRQGILSPIPTSELLGVDTALAGIASAQQQRLLRDAEQPGPRVASTAKAPGASADYDIELADFRVFGSAGVESLDRDETKFEAGYDSSIGRAVGGVAYSISPAWEAGLGGEYLRQEGDFNAGGNLDTTAYGIFGFVSILPIAGLRVTLMGEYLRSRLERSDFVEFDTEEVHIDGNIKSRYNGDAIRMSGLVSYLKFVDRFFFEPFAAIDWARFEYESYSQKGDTGIELNLERDDQTSLVSTVGLSVGLGFQHGSVGFYPSVTAAWKHEFEDDQRRINVSFVDDDRGKRFSFETQPPDRDYGVVSTSLVAVLPNGIQPYAVAQALVGNSLFDSYGVTIGVSYAF